MHTCIKHFTVYIVLLNTLSSLILKTDLKDIIMNLAYKGVIIFSEAFPGCLAEGLAEQETWAPLL